MLSTERGLPAEPTWGFWEAARGNLMSPRPRRNGIPRGQTTRAPALSGEFILHRYLGGSMRIGNRLGGVLVWALAATVSVAANARTTERVIVPLGGSLEGQTGERYFGVYVPTRFGGELKVTTTSGQVSELKGPSGAEHRNGQD